VWLARFAVEKAAGVDDAERARTFAEARGVVQGEDALDVWLWGVAGLEEGAKKIALKVRFPSMHAPRSYIRNSANMTDSHPFFFIFYRRC
jgi:hypothetical protein